MFRRFLLPLLLPVWLFAVPKAPTPKVDEMGIGENVTTFTISDFGRSLSPNGAGTDHGWGSHAFVIGGSVKDGKLYGRMPRIEVNSPDAWYDRLVPTISMESYLATMVKWFGASDQELDEIFPNLKSFPIRDLGYMGERGVIKC